MFLVLNAGKRSLGLDVKSPDGLAVAQRLIERSDVFVQSLRPGLAERLGLGFEQLAGTEPAPRLLHDRSVRGRRAPQHAAGIRPAHAGRRRDHERDR